MFIADAKRLLEYEAQSLLHRLSEIRPFALTLPMVPAAAPSVAAQAAIEAHLSEGRRELRGGVHRFLRWLRSPRGSAASPSEAQARFTTLRLPFLTMIDQFDVWRTRRRSHRRVDASSLPDEPATDHLPPRSRRRRGHQARQNATAGRRVDAGRAHPRPS